MQVRGVSEVLSRLLETGLVNGQQALLPDGGGLSPAATGVMEQARTAVVLSAHLIADNVRICKYQEGGLLTRFSTLKNHSAIIPTR